MIRLECTTGGHNKFYEFDIIRTNDRVKVTGRYGAIGKSPQDTLIYDGDSETEARKELDKKQNEKLKKGYVLVGENGKASTPAPTPSKNGVPTVWPQSALGIADGNDSLRRFIDDPAYIAQEKIDGMRGVVHITKDGLRIFSMHAGVGDPFHPLEKTSSLPHLAQLQFPSLVGTILDCEILGPGHNSAARPSMVNSKNGSNRLEEIFVFDLIAYCGTDWTGRILAQRLSTLMFIEPLLKSPYVTVLPRYSTTKQKQRLFDTVMETNAEGVMFKNLDAVYVQGARPANNWFKFKKSKQFDCVVTGFTNGAGKYNSVIGAVKFGQYTNGELVELGQASGMSDSVRNDMARYPHKYLGKVVTIKGQERLKSGAIRHPVFLGLNETKRPKDCVWYEGEQ